jgi:hypothetical protein
VARLATSSQGARQIARPLTEGPGPTNRPGSLPAPRVAYHCPPAGFGRQQAGLFHWPYGVDGVPKLVCTKVTGEADPCDRPQKIRIELFLSSMLHHYDDHKEARSCSWPCVDCKVAQINEKNKPAGLCDRPNPFTSYSSFICNADLMDEGKLGYGFTSADELKNRHWS